MTYVVAVQHHPVTQMMSKRDRSAPPGRIHCSYSLLYLLINYVRITTVGIAYANRSEN